MYILRASLWLLEKALIEARGTVVGSIYNIQERLCSKMRARRAAGRGPARWPRMPLRVRSADTGRGAVGGGDGG